MPFCACTVRLVCSRGDRIDAIFLVMQLVFFGTMAALWFTCTIAVPGFAIQEAYGGRFAIGGDRSEKKAGSLVIVCTRTEGFRRCSFTFIPSVNFWPIYQRVASYFTSCIDSTEHPAKFSGEAGSSIFEAEVLLLCVGARASHRQHRSTAPASHCFPLGSPQSEATTDSYANSRITGALVRKIDLR